MNHANKPHDPNEMNLIIRDTRLPSLQRSIILAICLVAIVHLLAALTSCSTSNPLPIAVGLEYRIKDTPVTLVVTPSSKGGYDWSFKVAEGQVTDWLEKLPDGSYLIKAKDGTQVKVARGADGKPIITIIATGETIKVVPKPVDNDPPADAVPAEAIPLA